MDFYVSPEGSDLNSGRSEEDPFQSFEVINSMEIKNISSVLLEGGTTITGGLSWSRQKNGANDHEIHIKTYGREKAKINAQDKSGIYIENLGNIHISNLEVFGSGYEGGNDGSGVTIINTMPGDQKIANIRVDSVIAHGFCRQENAAKVGVQPPQGCGIYVGGFASDGSKSGYDNVGISHCETYSNQYYGILVTGYWQDEPEENKYANSNVYIGYSKAHDNMGDSLYLDNHSGSGIFLEDVDVGVVEHCQAWNNGALCFSDAGGPVGIWAAVANKVTIQHCESYNNKSNVHDGGGFDLDGGSSNCVLQNNISHHNFGSGYLIYRYGGAPHKDHGNIVRNNISIDDARVFDHHSGIRIANSGKDMTALKVYGNIIIKSSGKGAALGIYGKSVEADIFNNFLIAKGNIDLVSNMHPGNNVFLAENLYWNYEGQVTINWGNMQYSDLLLWSEKTSQEKSNGKFVGKCYQPYADSLFLKWINNSFLDQSMKAEVQALKF